MSLSNTDGDLKIVERAVSGESSAFGLLYDKYQEQIFRFIYVKVGRREDTEDLAAQVFLQALTNLSDWRDLGYPFSSWLYRIARNAVADFYRASKKTASLEDIPVEQLGLMARELEVDTDIALSVHRVREAMSSLKEEYQDVLLMRFVDDMSIKDTAAAIGKSEGATKLLTHRAVRTLREKLRKAGSKNEAEL
jgi:RNA polymerase sigma-70 factor (ECF subfamily)